MNRQNRFFTLKLSLYTSSIVIGAGLLTLPTTAANLGFAPLIVAIVLIGAWMAFVSRKTAVSLYFYAFQEAKKEQNAFVAGIDRASAGQLKPHGQWSKFDNILSDTVRRSGSRLLPRLTNEAGFGLAGKVTILLGIILYVVFADISYTILGSRALQSITIHSQRAFPHIFPYLLVGGMVLAAFAWNFDRVFASTFLLKGTIKKILVMLSAWIIGIALLGIFRPPPESGIPPWYEFLAMLVFFGAVIAGMYTHSPVSHNRQALGMVDQHTVNMLVMIFEIALLFITIGIMAWKIIAYQMTVPFYALSPTALSLTKPNLEEWATMIGVVIFSLVGTGLYNLLSYPQLFEPSNNSRSNRLVSVVNLGTAIPTLIYLLWTAAVAFTLNPATLAGANISKMPLTVPIADKFEAYDANAAWLIILFGYSLTLLAVTSACNGFTESLADQIRAALPDRLVNLEPSPHFPIRIRFTQALRSSWQAFIDWLSNDDDSLSVRLVILIGALLAAFAIDKFIPIDISSILSIAGNAGGGLLILILPFFLTGPDGKRSPLSSIWIGLGSAFILTMLSLTASKLDPSKGAISLVVSIVCVAIGLSIMFVTFWLIFYEIKLRRQALTFSSQP